MLVLRIFDRSGRPIGELNDIDNVSASYLINKAAQLTWNMGIAHPKATLEYLDDGNLVIGYSDELPTWCGFINRRHWAEDTLTVTAVDILQRLQRRFCRPARISNQPAGAHFSHIINEANSRESTGITVNTVFAGGAPITLDYATETSYDKLQSVLDLAKLETRVEMLTPNVWQISLYEKLGRDLTQQVIVIAGIDTDGAPDYEEDSSDYANDIAAGGKAPDSGSTQLTPEQEWDKRPKGYFTDAFAIGLRGLAEAFIDKMDITDLTTLEQAARAEGVKREQPKRPLTLKLNRKRNLWSTFREGDIICVQIPYYGFTGLAIPFRVLGLEVNESSTTSSLVLAGEVVAGDDAQNLAMFKAAQYGTGAGYLKPSSPDS